MSVAEALQQRDRDRPVNQFTAGLRPSGRACLQQEGGILMATFENIFEFGIFVGWVATVILAAMV
jgi:hypothetical protein